VTAYNFCKVHSTLGCTPAAGLKLATETWTIEKLIDESTRSAYNRKRFNRALAAYCGMKDKDVSNYDLKHITYALFGGKLPNTDNITDYELGKTRLSGFLRDMIKCSK